MIFVMQKSPLSADPIRRNRLPTTPVARHGHPMKTSLPAALLLATALAACSPPADKPESPRLTRADATVTRDWPQKAEKEQRFTMKADGETGEIAMDYAEGVGASLRLPPEIVREMGAGSKVDLGGVGLYPGARVTRLEVAGSEEKSRKNNSVDIVFTAPDSPAKVADWYVAAFQEKGHQARREGNRVFATTSEGSEVMVDLKATGATSRGIIKVEDSPRA
jgi:hypothetical protein